MTLGAIIGVATVNFPISLILLYIFNHRKWWSIPLTIITGTLLTEVWRSTKQANYHSEMFYITLAGFIVSTVVAFGLIKLKERITKYEEAKYSDHLPPE